MDPRLMIAAYHHKLFFPDMAYRCPRCEQGRIVASDGFMMAQCSNCGTFHAGAADFMEWGFLGDAADKMNSWLFKAWKRITSHAKTQTCEASGGAVGSVS